MDTSSTLNFHIKILNHRDNHDHQYSDHDDRSYVTVFLLFFFKGILHQIANHEIKSVVWCGVANAPRERFTKKISSLLPRRGVSSAIMIFFNSFCFKTTIIPLLPKRVLHIVLAPSYPYQSSVFSVVSPPKKQ